MATEADIPAPVCETRAEQGFHIADQATNISHNKLPHEEKNRADIHNEPATVAGEDFLPTPSIDQVHCEVNKMSSDATEKDETVISLVTSPELDDQSLQSAVNAVDPYEMIQHKDEKSNVSDKDVRVETELSKDTTHGETTEEEISGNLATSDESKEVECEHNKIPPEINFADSLEIAAEKASQEPKVQVDDEQFEKESEKLQLADLSADGNESTFVDKVIDEKEGPTKAQLFETEENITTLLKKDVDIEKPVESLHEVPEIIEASDLSQENKTTSSSEEHSTNANQHVIVSDDPEEKTIVAVEEHKEVLESFPTIVSSSSKEESVTAESECVDEETIDKVDTQKEILEDFPTVVQNEEIEENSNKVVGSDTKDEETLEKGSEEMSLPLPLAREANVDEPMVMHEAGVEHGELRKTELCENESTESIEKPEDSLNVVSEDIKESDPDQEIETRSHTEEQIEAAQPQADLDEKTDDKILNVAETKEEILEKTEQGFHIADQATNPADIHNEPCTVEGEDFLTTPSIDQVHCEVNEMSSDPTEQPDQTEKDETVIQLLRSPELDDQSLQSAADAVDSYEEIQQTAGKSNVSDKDVIVETELSKGEVVSHERNFADSLEIGAEKASQDNSSSVETVTNTTSADEFQGKNNLDSSFCENGTTKGELFETEENITILKEDVDTEKPVEFLHEVPEVTEASDLSQENKATSSPEEDSTTANQHVIVGDDTEEKTIDAVEEHKEVLESFPIIVSSSPKEESVTAESECMDEKAVDKVDTQKEILEDFSAVVPNEEIEENSNKVDGSNTKDEETLEKESDEMSLPLPLAREANDDESIIKQEDSLNVVSEDIKESDLDREIETRSYTEEQIEAAQPQAAMDEKTDDKTLDAAETKEEILENMPTCVLDEKTEGESLVQDDSTKVKNEDHLEKDSDEASNDDVITTIDEVKVEVEYPSRAELFHEEKNDGADFNEKTQELQQSVEINVSTQDNDRELEKEIVTPSLEEASTKEAPEESTESTLLKEEHLQDHEAPASSDDIEINHTLEDQSLTAIPHAITSERTIDPTDTKAVCLEVQNVATEIPHMESEAHLGKESEKSSLTEETNETESKNLSEPKEDKDPVEAELSEKENNSAITLVTEKNEEIMESDFGEKTTNPQEISSDKPEEETIDAVEKEEEILHVQGIATSISHGDNEDKSSIEEDCSQHPSSNETSSGQANDDEAAITREANFVDESLIKAESFESEKNAEVTLVKEEVSIESLQVAANDIKDSAVEQDTEISFKEYKTKEESHEEMVEHLEKDSDSTSLAEAPTMDTIESTEEIGESGSGQSTETTSTEEQILTGDTQEISRDKTEEKSDDAAYTKGNTIDAQDNETNEDSSPIEEDCSERPSTIIHEAKLADQNLIKAKLFENEESAKGNLAKEELSTRSLEVPDEDTRASASDQDRETSSIEEQGLSTSTSGIIDDQKEDKTIDATETPEDKNVATTTLDEETEENSLVQVACQKDDPEKESENASQIGETTESTLKDDAEVEKAADSIEVVNEDTKDNCEESTIIHESEVADQGLLKAELFENEKNTEGNLAHEEVSVRSLEVSDEDIKASASGQDRDISSTEEDNTIDATETPEDKNVATTLHEETEKNSPIQVDCQKEHSEKESENTPPTGETTESTLKDDAVVEKAVDSLEVVNEDFNESKLADQSLTKAELFENEESTEGNLAKDEVSIRSLEVSDEDIKATASGQDRETCSIEEQGLTTSPSGIIDDQKEDKTIDATETPEDKNVATTTLHEESEENSPIQVDYQKQDLEKESEDTSQTVEISESTLKDDALVEKVVDSFEVVKEDIKASAFVSTGTDNDEESTVIHESKVTDQSLIKAELFENAKSAEVYLAQQEVSIRSLEVSDEDIKASTSGQDIETCSIEEKGLTTSPSGIIDDQKEDKTIDATESPEDKNVATTTLHEETEENSPIQVDCQKEDLEKESEDTSQTGETTESTLKDDAVVEKAADSFEVVKEDIKAPAVVFTGNDNDEESTKHEPELADQNLIKAELFENEESTEGDLAKEEVSIRSLEVSDDDIKASASGQDREICSLEEKGPTTSPSGIIDDQKEDKAVDATETPEDKNVATTTLHDETEKNSLIQVDCQKEYLEKETENTSQTGETTESTLKDDTEEQIQTADLQEISCAKEEEKTFDTTYTEGQTLEVRDVETDVQREQNEDNSPSSIDVETPTAEVQETLGDKINERTTDVTDAKEDCLEVQDITTNVPNGDDEDNSPTEADSSQNPSLEEAPMGNAEDHESIIMHQAKFVDENLIKANLFESEKTSEGTLIKEETESLQFADGDIKAPASCEDREISSLEEQSLIADPTGNIAEEKEDETIDPTDLSEETSKDEVPKEIDAVETKAVITELNEEEIYLRDLHKTNAVDIAAHEENASSSDAVKIPSTNGSDEVSEEHILENQREIQQDAETEEAHKQDEDLHVSAPCQDSSMEKIDKDVQLCLASTNDSDVTEEVLPARDDNITEKTDIKESEVLKDDQKPNAREQEETECGQILLDETVEETKELVSIPVANDAPIMSFTETSEVDHFTSERELTIDREELQTEKTETADDKETKNDEDKGEEEEAHEQKIPDFSSAATNVLEARDQDVAGFLSEAPEKIGVAPEEKKSEHESKDQVLEFKKGEREYAFIGNVMVIDEESESSIIGVAPEEKESEYESKNQVLESIAQVQSCDIIPKATEMKTAEENTETAAEIKSGNVLAEDIVEPKITPYDKESMKVDISSEKGDEDLEDYHLGSCKEEVITERCLESEVKQEEINTEEIFEVITNGNETEKVSEVSEETDDKAVEHPETILLANESIDHQKELGKSGEEVTAILDTEEVKSSNRAVLENEEERIGAADKEMAKDEVLLDQNSNTSVIDETVVELPKTLDENIICEAPPTKTVHETIEEFEGKNEEANTKHESLPLPEFTQGKESEKQDQKYEICTPEEQAEDEENFTAGKGKEEAEGAGTWTKPTEDEDRNTFVQAAELDEVLNGDGAQDIPMHNKSSTTKNEYFEEKYPNKSTEAQISSASGDTELIEQVIKDEGVDSRQVEEVSDECKQIKETSTLVEPVTIPTSEIMQEYKVETSPETKDQLKEVDDLPQESNVSDAELKMAQRDGPPDLQNARDISENVQELNEGSVELSKKENPVEVYPSENIEAKVSSEEQKTEKIQKVLVPETLDQEIEEQQPGSTSSKAVLKACEEDKIIEKVSELQSSTEDTAQSDKKEETERQIDSLPVLPHVKCPAIETEEKDLPLRSDAAELEVIPLPSSDKHVVLEPSKCEPEEANSGHKEGTSQKTTESKEMDTPSLMDLLQTPTKKTSEMASRSEDVQADEAVCEDAKSDEEKDDEEESSEQRRPDLGSEAPVMVDMGDADLKTPHKKSHNILSGVGSKVKHSIAKVKKAITGKSSHPKPPSPK